MVWYDGSPLHASQQSHVPTSYEKEFKDCHQYCRGMGFCGKYCSRAERTWTFSKPHMRSPNSIFEYSFICDGTFLNHLIVNNIAPADTAISNILGGSVKLFTTRCDHEQMKNAEGCIVEIIGENNLDHFFVGTQDTDMRKKFRRLMEITFQTRFEECQCELKILLQNAIARLEALENDYTGIETVEAVDDDEASLEDDGIRLQVKENVFDALKACNVFCVSLYTKKQKDTNHKTRQVKALENARKSPRNFLELLHEGSSGPPSSTCHGISALFVSSFPIIHVRSVECVFVQSDARRYMMIPLAINFLPHW
uniref:Uncharacterized protein n=1 Tax=Salix viminalis TaxID=40686 RepID=A0A6N2LRU4_SALVM